MKFCMKCMTQYDDDLRICPECGFAEGTMPENARCAEPGIVLADRYIIGMPLNIDGWFVKYIGWDALTSKKVSIYEYSPVRFSERKIGDTKITALKEKEFYKYMETLQKKAQLLAEQHLPENVSAVYESFEKNGTAYIIAEYVKGTSLAEYLKEQGRLSPEKTEKLFLPLLRSIDILHESGFVIGGFSVFDLLILDDGTLFLNSYLENILYNVTDDQTDINQKEKRKFFPPERLKSPDSPALLPANDVFSAAMIMHMMMGVPLPEPDARTAYYDKHKKDKLKPLGAYRVKLSSDKAAALRNASFISSEFRTPDMETFIKELSGGKKVQLRTNKNKGLPLWAKILIPLGCALLIAGGVILAVYLRKSSKPQTVSTLQSEMTIVPDLGRLHLRDAEQQLTQSELLLSVIGRQTDNSLEPDTVLAQNLAVGSFAAKNSVVGVIVSVKSELITMPNFIGMNAAFCSETADNLGLKYTVTQEYSRSVEKDCVIRQSLAPYTEVRADTPLELTVSLGRDPDVMIEDHETTVESHIGQTYEQFLSEAEKSGTPVKIAKRVHDSSKPEGTIVNQYPPADTVQNTADGVSVEVTTANEDVIVPNVILLNRNKAESVLAIYGLTAAFQEDYTDCAVGLIAVQQPDAGSHTKAGTQVTLTVSKGKKLRTVPELVGKQYADAVSLLTENSLSPRIEYAADSAKPEGEILAQSIAAGTEVSQGTAVLLTVNSGGTLGEIPDVIGMKAEDAKKAIEAAGFRMAVYVSDDYKCEEGIVIAQTPSKGVHAEKEKLITVLLTEQEKPTDESSDALAAVYDIAEDPLDFSIIPESILRKPDEEFVLQVEWKQPDHAGEITYQLSEEGIIQETAVDQQAHTFRFRAVKPGIVLVTVSSGDRQKLCLVEVEGEEQEELIEMTE